MERQDSVVKCRSCGKESTVSIPVKCDFGVFGKYMKSQKCPHCGAGSKMLEMVRTTA